MDNEKYINRAEAMRYLMLGETLPEGRITELLVECENELIQAAKPRFVSREFEISDCPIDISGDEVKAHLSGCKKVLLFAATLGSEPDRLVRAYQINDITKAVIFNACADAFIESFCEEADSALASAYGGQYLTWRYGVGYAGLPLSEQKKLLESIDASRRIGLSVSDSFILTPLKSVTAVIGISDSPIDKKRRGCAVCAMKENCAYRKAGKRCGY